MGTQQGPVCVWLPWLVPGEGWVHARPVSLCGPLRCPLTHVPRIPGGQGSSQMGALLPPELLKPSVVGGGPLGGDEVVRERPTEGSSTREPSGAVTLALQPPEL